MNFFESLIINVIIMLFPLMMYLFYALYSQNASVKAKEIILDVALISSFYLLVSYNQSFNVISIVLLNIPLIISYLKKHTFISVILSMLIIISYINFYHYILLTILNYLFYYILYWYQNKHKKSEPFFVNIFILTKVILLLLIFYIYQTHTIQNFINTLLFIIIFVVIIKSITYVIKKGEEIINLNMNIKDIEKDKQFRTSLFKITHEIKNPIAVCKSYLDMFDFNNSNHQKYIPIIKDEINKILLLLQDFLAMNKIKIEFELLDINLLLEETIFQLEPVLKTYKSKFEYEISDDEIFVNGDYNRLSQVLINVIKNALEAEATNVKISSLLDKNSIVIIVEDNGIGIDEDELEHISEPFYTTKKNGTGLGVSLSTEIVNAHHGSIEYTSKKNIGTKVSITLPIFNY